MSCIIGLNGLVAGKRKEHHARPHLHEFAQRHGLAHALRHVTHGNRRDPGHDYKSALGTSQKRGRQLHDLPLVAKLHALAVDTILLQQLRQAEQRLEGHAVELSVRVFNSVPYAQLFKKIRE